MPFIGADSVLRNADTSLLVQFSYVDGFGDALDVAG